MAGKWKISVDIGGGGILGAEFDEYIIDERRRLIVLAVATKVLEKFLSFGEKIPLAVMESMQMGGHSFNG